MTSALHDEVLTAVVAAGLPGSLRELPHGELSEEEADALVATAREHRIPGMVLAAVRTEGLRLPAAAEEAILDLYGLVVAGSRRLESELVWVTQVLDRAGIESRVIGDVALARLDYREPGLRAVDAIGLLLRPPDMNHAIERLRGSGWHARPDAYGGARLHGPSGQRLELHTSVNPTPPGVRVDPRGLWADSRALQIAGRKLATLGEEQRLLHECFHAVVSDPGPAQLVRQRDVVEAVLFGAWDRGRLMALAGAWGAEHVLAQAVRAAWQRLAIADVTALSVWAGADLPGETGQSQRENFVAVSSTRLPGQRDRPMPRRRRLLARISRTVGPGPEEEW